MAQRRRVSNTPYIYDNTARDLQIRRQMEEPPGDSCLMRREKTEKSKTYEHRLRLDGGIDGLCIFFW